MLTPLALLLLTTCSGGSTDVPSADIKAAIAAGCPALPDYDAPTEAAAKAEFDRLAPAGFPVTRRLIIDYGTVRKEARACAGAR